MEARLEFRSRRALVQAMAQEQPGRTDAPIADGQFLYLSRPFRPLWIVGVREAKRQPSFARYAKPNLVFQFPLWARQG